MRRISMMILNSYVIYLCMAFSNTVNLSKTLLLNNNKHEIDSIVWYGLKNCNGRQGCAFYSFKIRIKFRLPTFPFA